MTWIWLFANSSLVLTGDDYGDFGIDTAKKCRIGSRSDKVLAIQWEVSIFPELLYTE
jgi:hypothetical protein